MHTYTIRLYIHDDDEKHNKVMNYIKKNKCNNIKKELNIFYTTNGKMIKESNQIKQIHIYEDIELNMKVNLLLQNHKINNNIISDCCSEIKKDNVYNLPKICFEINEKQEIFFINNSINYIIKKEYENDILINCSNCFEIKTENYQENIIFIKNM